MVVGCWLQIWFELATDLATNLVDTSLLDILNTHQYPTPHMSSSAAVEFSPLRTDLANLPGDLTTMLFNSNTAPQNLVVEISWNQGLRSVQRAYLGWSGMTSEKAGKLEIDPTFSQSIGLAQATKVHIKVHINPPVATQIHLEPVTIADWEIVETHANYLESWMINQVRAVSLAHPITVYPSSTSIACLAVTKIIPNPSLPFAKLSPDSQVIVAPKSQKKHDSVPAVVKKKKSHQALVLRCSAFPYTDISDANTRHPVLYADLGITTPYVQVSFVNPTRADSAPGQEDPSDLKPAKSVVAVLIQTKTKEPIMSYGLASALRAGPIGSILKIQGLSSLDPQSVIVHPYVTSTAPQSLAMNAPKQAQPDFAQLDLNVVANGMTLPPTEKFPNGAILECEGDYGSVGQVSLGSEIVLAESKVLATLEKLEIKPGRKVVGRDDVLKSVSVACMSGSGTLVYGSRASGKTSLVNQVVSSLEKQLIYKATFNSGNWLDKPVSAVREALKQVFLDAAWHAPSVVVLEDLDLLLPAELENSDSTRTEQLGEIFQSLVRTTTARRKVALLASAQSKEALSASLLSSHVFDELIHIKSPDKRVREAILEEALSNLELVPQPGFDILEVVGDTEGYQPGDLWTLVERITALVQLELSEGNTAQVTNTMFKQATDEFTPASLRGVKLQKSTVSWKEIGGLKEVKRVILETLEWPTKYAPIFANCPLRLRSGLLLYGYPGCGKTLMASAVAAQCGLNFISVKGPEILNKYIGASEQSVRDLFDRAQAAKPCVLFFDEFDSIAPKRGHDSTGVTDRVVNQMLTQMDGAEGLDGVYVLAATSRPDLIDGALLRPGRLDKSLLCDMPSFEDRLEIMQTAQSKMDLDDNVNLEEIANRTEGFSGADMQAVMTNAYLNAIHSTIEVGNTPAQTTQEVTAFHIGKGADFENAVNYANSSHGVENTQQPATTPAAAATKVKVTWADIEHSLSTTKPSISQKEVRKLRGIYEQFVSDRDGQMPQGTSSSDVGGRVTLQ